MCIQSEVCILPKMKHGVQGNIIIAINMPLLQLPATPEREEEALEPDLEGKVCFMRCVCSTENPLNLGNKALHFIELFLYTYRS